LEAASRQAEEGDRVLASHVGRLLDGAAAGWAASTGGPSGWFLRSAAALCVAQAAQTGGQMIEAGRLARNAPI